MMSLYYYTEYYPVDIGRKLNVHKTSYVRSIYVLRLRGSGQTNDDVITYLHRTLIRFYQLDHFELSVLYGYLDNGFWLQYETYHLQ